MPLARLHPASAEPALERPAPAPPRILLFDSGLGGLTVFAEVATLCPHADFVYAADDAVFPYGRLGEAELVARVTGVMEALLADHRPDVVVIACHTASTLVLPPLRARWPSIPFVGTVPAIKPAAAASESRLISVLATPGTVAREYTRELIRTFAADCEVTLVGARRLASLAEAALRGEPVAEAAIREEILPAFVEGGGRRTDAVVLACTHYPLLAATLARLAPWPVRWIDPAPAIARRVAQVLAEVLGERAHGHAPPVGSRSAPLRPALGLFSGGADLPEDLRRALASRGFGTLDRFDPRAAAETGPAGRS